MLTTGDAYLVGLFDGEGSISAVRNGSSTQYIHVAVCMASADVCDLFQERFGGSVTARSYLTAGGLRLIIWRQTGHAAREILELLAEHSVTKQHQARLALELIALTRPGGGRGTYRVSCDVLVEREQIARELAALNGARSRFGKAA